MMTKKEVKIQKLVDLAATKKTSHERMAVLQFAYRLAMVNRVDTSKYPPFKVFERVDALVKELNNRKPKLRFTSGQTFESFKKEWRTMPEAIIVQGKDMRKGIPGTYIVKMVIKEDGVIVEEQTFNVIIPEDEQ